jgi:hypothetical protein
MTVVPARESDYAVIWTYTPETNQIAHMTMQIVAWVVDVDEDQFEATAFPVFPDQIASNQGYLIPLFGGRVLDPYQGDYPTVEAALLDVKEHQKRLAEIKAKAEAKKKNEE